MAHLTKRLPFLILTDKEVENESIFQDLLTLWGNDIMAPEKVENSNEANAIRVRCLGGEKLVR